MQIFPAIRRVLCFFGVYYAMTNTYFILKKRYRFRLRYSPLFIKKNFGNDVDRYMPGASEEDKKRALANIGRFARKYHISVAEYFYLHFDEKTPEERAAFLSEYDRMIQSKLTNKRKFNRVFKNKYECSKLFAPYYKRECLQLVLPSEADKLEAFVEKYGAAIVKPTFSYGGQGIKKVAKIDGNAKLGVDAYLAGLEKGKESKCIVEELIVQDERMARVHPASVNTLRIYTFS